MEHKDVPCTLEELLESKWHFSKRLIRKIKTSGDAVTVNNKQVQLIESLTKGDIVQVKFPKEDRGVLMTAEYIPLAIIYEDDDLLIINKQTGIAMSPSTNHSSGTLANGIIYYYDVCDLPYTVHFVTRLDRDTSGIVIVAKHRYMHARLQTDFKKGNIIRLYDAIVGGRLNHSQGTICEPIARKPGSMIERVVDSLGKTAITHYDVIHQTEAYSHVSIQLETGRTHQIRVHFSHIGYPLIGDSLYGGDIKDMKQQALHCSCVSFTHPQTKEKITFQAPLRKELNTFLATHKK